LKPVSLAAIIRRATTIMKPAAAARKINLSEELENDLVEMVLDESRIMQILTNLLNNAIKFTPEGGKVGVKLRQDPKRPEYVEIAVTDNGCGIPQDQIEYIFDRLYQVNAEDAATQGGMGLGLYLCRELVLLHGGDIWVESEMGKGSSFTFTLPKTPRPKHSNLLIIDDDAALCQMLRQILELEGFNVETAGRGRAALELMRQQVPDVVLLDLAIPQMDGAAILKEIRKRWGQVSVIVYTGYPHGEVMARALESSPFTLLAKPCPIKQLVETIHRVKRQSDTVFLRKPTPPNRAPDELVKA
jgi:CheY-like chemotaxis protein/anti-sigma regulatory factor (Ser/Thr protein kinase)